MGYISSSTRRRHCISRVVKLMFARGYFAGCISPNPKNISDGPEHRENDGSGTNGYSLETDECRYLVLGARY